MQGLTCAQADEGHDAKRRPAGALHEDGEQHHHHLHDKNQHLQSALMLCLQEFP